MIKIFDHLYYRTYWWNKSIIKDSSPKTGGSIGVSLFKYINILTLVSIIFIYSRIAEKYHLWLIFLPCGIIFFYDLYYFIIRSNGDRIVKETQILSKQIIRKRDIIIILYMFLSILFVILAMIYLRDQNLSLPETYKGSPWQYPSDY